MTEEGLARSEAVARVEAILDAVESETMPVPVREVWVYGDVVLGVDPVPRVNVYLTKDLLFKDAPEREAEFVESHGIEGVGKTVRAAWADEHPEYLRANSNGHAAPEKCLAAHLLDDDEPVHLEVCNTGFERNVTQRLEGAKARDDYTQLLDPRAAMLWAGNGEESRRSGEALSKLRENEFVLPTLSAALAMLGLEDDEADRAAERLREYQRDRRGATVRGDVV
ncbi:DUF7095 family protein [Halosegnis marinus]|uniref:Uncharacterized protein n=1 Tax=Halosegnis marinus TaxID=3034023 RepID=A0ABD5ZN73_9EURY|nr:hypothetical protein [Halosegnis sp. DT85]